MTACSKNLSSLPFSHPMSSMLRDSGCRLNAIAISRAVAGSKHESDRRPVVPGTNDQSDRQRESRLLIASRSLFNPQERAAHWRIRGSESSSARRTYSRDRSELIRLKAQRALILARVEA